MHEENERFPGYQPYVYQSQYFKTRRARPLACRLNEFDRFERYIL